MSLVELAQETLAIIARGAYTAPSGREVPIRDAVDAAVRGTVLYRPGEYASLRAALAPHRDAGQRIVEVTPETTAEAARRLYEREGVARVAALNFASAKNPGGGFLRGTVAQEEDLSRCSALYTCQLPQRAYYDANRACGSTLYTDHIIYSPDVPFFRDDQLRLLDRPFLASVITAPAPNAGEALRNEPNALERVAVTLTARAGHVLTVAAAHGHRVLVLGAWGCGVFRNDPTRVAGVFDAWLRDDAFAGLFDRVVFAIYDRSKKGETRRAFEERFTGR